MRILMHLKRCFVLSPITVALLSVPASGALVWGSKCVRFAVPPVLTSCGTVATGCPGTCTKTTSNPDTAGNCGSGAFVCVSWPPATGTVTSGTYSCGVTGGYFPKCDCSGIAIATTTTPITYTCL